MFWMIICVSQTQMPYSDTYSYTGLRGRGLLGCCPGLEAGGHHLPALPRPCESRRVPSFSPFLPFLPFPPSFLFPFLARALVALPLCLAAASEHHLRLSATGSASIPCRGIQHSGVCGCHRGDAPCSPGLCSWIPREGNNWRDSPWRATTSGHRADGDCNSLSLRIKEARFLGLELSPRGRASGSVGSRDFRSLWGKPGCGRHL